MTVLGPLPPRDCPFCPRLAAFRQAQQKSHPEWFNAPVPPFGGEQAELLIVGLAPGLKGANRTGRPFTGDYAGGLLYRTLAKFGFAEGVYDARPDDGLELRRVRITNAVRCVPPQNRPEPGEIATCRPFLAAEIAGMPCLRAILALGAIAHQTVLAALGLRRGPFPFEHARVHELPSGLVLADSYHCSRLNTATGKLSVEMFEAVFAELAQRLDNKLLFVAAGEVKEAPAPNRGSSRLNHAIAGAADPLPLPKQASGAGKVSG